MALLSFFSQLDDRGPGLTGKQLCLIIVGVIILAGCATTGDPRLAHIDKPVKILVIETPPTIAPDRLRKVLAPNSQTQSAPADNSVAEGLNHARDYAAKTMQATLASRPGLLVVSAPADKDRFFRAIRDHAMANGLTQQQAEQLQAMSGADALLLFTLTDYGLTPRAWRKGYVTFEITTTLGLAAIIAYAGSTVAKAAAGAYLVQEAVEETAETYAGFWAVDVVSRPVRIEAEVFGLKPLTKGWKYHSTGFSDLDFARLTSTATPAQRRIQLDQATDAAAADIADTLSVALHAKQRPYPGNDVR